MKYSLSHRGWAEVNYFFIELDSLACWHCLSEKGKDILNVAVSACLNHELMNDINVPQAGTISMTGGGADCPLYKLDSR